jgi:guanosine-3',5'-bis(diphosphate) 3'-pyrophosphohydrolase
MPSSFRQLKEEVSRYLQAPQTALIERAYVCAERAHKGQKRQSGEAYITHPVAAALTLAKLRMDYQTIMAALLHDVLEDTPVDKAALIADFGEEVAELVDGVSKLTQIEFGNREEAQAENFRKMILAMVRDIRVILVKLADRLHNMRTLGSKEPHKRHRIALETLDIYAPIANRLGMHELRLELEDLGFSALYPRRYRVLKSAVAKAGRNRREVMNTIETALKEALEKTPLPPVAVIGRQKHLYSIYKKMRAKHLSFNEIMDIFGFRIVTDNIDTCYRVLGAVHGLYKPVPEKFKDYIAIPKSNGYQSLHTTLFGPFGVPVEIQIRNADMDNIAEHGIAAHWLYKSKETSNTAQIRAREWLKTLLEMQQSTGNSIEFIENVKIDLFPNEVYVFTPNGRILELPAGATPVDFAYAIHSDIGNMCAGAKINRRLSPLSTKLINGQTVEIITAAGARPSPAWLSFVVTGKARGNIRYFLKSQKRAESITFGEELLRVFLSSLHLTWPQLSQEAIDQLLDFYQMKSVEDLMESVGLGNILPINIVRRIAHILKLKDTSEIFPENNKTVMAIHGTEGMALTFASCCRPIPGDPVIGIVEANQGINVHLEDCPVIVPIRYKSAEKCLPLQWYADVSGEFPVDIIIEAINQRGLLAQLTTTISKSEADINNINLIETEGGQYCHIDMTISVCSRIHLAQVIRLLRSVSLITHIARRKAV